MSELALSLNPKKQLEFAWAAGFYEGEGSIVMSKSYGVTLSASQADMEPLEKMQEIFGGTIVEHTKGRNWKPNWKDAWQWRLSKRLEVCNAVWHMGPWLSERRLSHALNLVEYLYTRTEFSNEYCSNLHPRSEFLYICGTTGVRRCRQCDTDARGRFNARRQYIRNNF